METPQNGNLDNEKIVVHFDNEFDGLGDIEFKPITRGLGFHNQDKKKKTIKKLGTKRTVPTRKMESRSIPTVPSLGVSRPSLMSEVSLDQPVIEEKRNEIVATPTEKNGEFYARQLGAWITDIIFLAVLSSLIVALPYFAITLDFKIIPEIMMRNEARLALVVIFSCFYLLYFTLMDIVGGIGKTIFKLRLVSLDSEVPSFFQSFIRSFVSLLSLLALGLPCVLNFQGRLSETDLEAY